MERKLQAVDHLPLLHALLSDVKRGLVDCDHTQLDKDFDELANRVRTRGLTVLMDDLPAFGKVFDKGLSDGFIKWADVPNSLRIKGRTLFSTVFYRSFRANGSCIDPEPEDVFFGRCILYLFKKVKHASSSETNSRAMAEFYAIDEENHIPCLAWDSDSLDYPVDRRISFADAYVEGGLNRGILQILDRVSWYLLPQSFFDWDDYRPKHGPGAVSDMSARGDKYSFPSWPATLSRVFPSNGWASHVHDCTEDSLLDYWGENHPSSKLICVPKTLSKPRVIASEPTAHMYCQQAIMRYLRDTMTSVASRCISFDNQGFSQIECLNASRLGDKATVDLSSASDRLSCWVVERFVKNVQLLEALHASRTRTVVSEIHPEPRSLRKFAPMGSAVTFPIQSLFYAAASITAVLVETKYCKGYVPTYDDVYLASSHVRVFGDDIIIPKRAIETLHDIFSFCGLKINWKKTHFNGFFRESCGMDAYKGIDVTPLYLQHASLGHSLSELPSWVEVSNNAYRKGLWCVANAMQQMIGNSFLRMIPVTKGNLGCVRFFTYQSGETNWRSCERWNVNLQKTEHKAICVMSRRSVESRNDWKDLLQYFIEGSDNGCLQYLDPALTKVGLLSSYLTKVVVRWV